MTVKDLKRLLKYMDDDAIVVLKDEKGWCNLQNAVDNYRGVVALLVDQDSLFFGE